jgi:hypothetical protein
MLSIWLVIEISSSCILPTLGTVQIAGAISEISWLNLVSLF